MKVFSLLIVFITLIISAGDRVRVYYYYDALNDSYMFTNVCSNLNQCRPLIVKKGTVRHKQGFRINPGNEHAYDAIIKEAASRYKVDFFLIKSLIKAESLFDRYARSTQGAQGLMQLMPETAKMLGVRDAYSPQEAILGGTKYLRQLLDRFKKVEHALAAYNAGPAAVVYYGGIPPYRETKGYVSKIKKFYFGYTRKML